MIRLSKLPSNLRRTKVDCFLFNLYKIHFGIKDYPCDQCDKKFTTVALLKQHYSIHEGIIYYCKLCKTYEGASINAITGHLRKKHEDVIGKNLNWETVQQKYVDKK